MCAKNSGAPNTSEQQLIFMNEPWRYKWVAVFEQLTVNRRAALGRPDLHFYEWNTRTGSAYLFERMGLNRRNILTNLRDAELVCAHNYWKFGTASPSWFAAHIVYENSFLSIFIVCDV